MTDNETPERIALNWSEGAAVTSGPLFAAFTRWVREDVAQAMVAAALERAADERDSAGDFRAADAIRAAIRARKTPPAGDG